MSEQDERAEWDRAYANGEVSEEMYKAMTGPTGSWLAETTDKLERLRHVTAAYAAERDKDVIEHFRIFGEKPKVSPLGQQVSRMIRGAIAECDEMMELIDDQRNGTVGRYSREKAAKAAALAASPGQKWREIDERLRAIPTEEYASQLARVEFFGGRALCPFHEGDNQSALGVPPQDEHGFNCFACGAGGGIYQFAGLLWNIDPRGDGFKQIRTRLAREFGLLD